MVEQASKEFERDQKKKKRIMELLAAHSNSRAFKVLFDYLDMEIENCRDGLEEKDNDQLRGALKGYRTLKNSIITAKEVVEALNVVNADTPE